MPFGDKVIFVNIVQLFIVLLDVIFETTFNTGDFEVCRMAKDCRGETCKYGSVYFFSCVIFVSVNPSFMVWKVTPTSGYYK